MPAVSFCVSPHTQVLLQSVIRALQRVQSSRLAHIQYIYRPAVTF